MFVFEKHRLVDTVRNEEVMHDWEKPIMKRMAEFVCQDGGDIIEFGFGMGISATHIQKQNIKSHTICENNPVVLERLYKWAKGRDNVIVLEGDWYDNINSMKLYNGVFFDTHRDTHTSQFGNLLECIARVGCRVSWWNNNPFEYDEFGLEQNVQYEVMDVNPPANDYFNHRKYYMPTTTMQLTR